MHDAAVLQKTDRLFLHSVNQSVTAVWGEGAKVVLVHLLLDEVSRGGYATFSIFNQGGDQAGTVTLFLCLLFTP